MLRTCRLSVGASLMRRDTHSQPHSQISLLLNEVRCSNKTTARKNTNHFPGIHHENLTTFRIIVLSVSTFSAVSDVYVPYIVVAHTYTKKIPPRLPAGGITFKKHHNNYKSTTCTNLHTDLL